MRFLLNENTGNESAIYVTRRINFINYYAIILLNLAKLTLEIRA
jgi:hypothetical protein